MGADSIEPEGVVITTESVAGGQDRVLKVVHQNDGTWQFIGSTFDEGEVPVALHFSHLLQQDPSLSQVEHLPPGGVALREFKGWSVRQFGTDEELDAYFDA